MDADYLDDYVGKVVKLILTNNYFYIGRVLGLKNGSLQILDKTGKIVSLSSEQIILIEEVKK